MLLRLSYRPVLVLAALVLTSACASSEEFLGTELTNGDEAADFSLRDHYGRLVRLSDLRGKVVALTFLYTYCLDICPVVADHVRDTHAMLGDEAADVAIVAVSVDPERDTQARALEYSRTWRMEDRWAFLVGAEEELAPVWTAYFIGPAVDDRGAEPDTKAPVARTPAPTGVDALRDAIATAFLVIHSAPVYLIDREGTMRVVFTLPFEPESLTHDIRLLLDS